MSPSAPSGSGANNSILSLGRQLGAYVLAADFADLSGADDERFRAWLDDIRTRELGGHGRWTHWVGTHEDAPNNWGSFTGASRIAASLYLGDTDDVQRAAQVLRGFLGDRSAWDRFQDGRRSGELGLRAGHATRRSIRHARGTGSISMARSSATPTAAGT